MCGIIGAICDDSVNQVLLDGLKRLEYRGYDSAGVTLLNSDGLEIYKFAYLTESIDKLSQVQEVVDSKSKIGLAHTRWATHGIPNDLNAHPHFGCDNRIAIVHNGIIENFRDLRNALKDSGHDFASNTDSEVIAHLLEENLSKLASEKLSVETLLKAFGQTLKLLEGTYAIGVIFADFPDRILVAKNMSPVVIGLGKSGNYVSSDVSAILEQAETFVYLKDLQMASVSKDDLKVYDFDFVQMEFSSTEIAWSYQDAQKSGYETFMLKEMHEEPKAFSETLVGRNVDDPALFFDEIRFDPKDLQNIQKIFLVGCGTSYHSAMVAKYALEHWSRIPVELDIASEFRYRDPVLDSSTLVIGITQSGETIDTLAALDFARKSRAKVLCVTNVVGSSVTSNVDAVMYTRAGPEISVAATKSYISQLSMLLAFSIAMGRTTGGLFKSEAYRFMDELENCTDKIRTALTRESQYRDTAKKFKDVKDFFFIGRHMGYPTSLEAALKLKEISYLHAEGYPAGELKHGPIAVLDDTTAVVGIATKNKLYDKLLSNMEEVRARNARVLVVANDSDSTVSNYFEDVFYVPDTFDLFSPVVDIIPLQFLAYELAIIHNNDVDKPRNLAKTVTVE